MTIVYVYDIIYYKKIYFIIPMLSLYNVLRIKKGGLKSTK